jgi:hypothetical protein
VPGEYKRVLEAASPNSRGESDVPKTEQALGSRISHGVDIRLCI